MPEPREVELMITLNGMTILSRRQLTVSDWAAPPMTLQWNVPFGLDGNANFIGITVTVNRAYRN